MKYFFNRQVFSTHILIIISYITKDDDNLDDGLDDILGEENDGVSEMKE